MKCSSRVLGSVLGLLSLALTSGLAGCSGGTTSGEVDAGSTPSEDLTFTGPFPFITEFLAKNQAGLTDEDGATSDWIEIYNPGSQPFDLSGYHLTDSKTKADRWTFPTGTVMAPGSYLVVFASGKNRAVAGKPLHTNFSLSGGELGGSCSTQGGEYLALTGRGGDPLPPVWSPYPGQATDVSYGLLTTATDSATAHFGKPTPGAPNDPSSALAERVRFGPASRTFASGTPLPVTLSVSSQTAQVRYTTNRSRPIGVAGTAGTFVADATTDVATWTAHGLKTGDQVRVSGPAPLVVGMNYFVQALTADTFKLTIEPGGPAIDLTASGSFELRRDAATGTAAATDFITTSMVHSFFGGDPVQVKSTGTLPGGLSATTTYYIVPGTTNTFRLSTSPTLTPVVDILDAGTGTLQVYRTPSPLYTNPINVSVNTRIRARAFEPGRPDGPLVGEMYFALDPAALAFTSNLPVVLSHTWNTAMANNTPVEGVVMVFEPKAPDNLTRLSNLPDLVAPGSLERRGSSTAGDPKFSMALELQDENGIDQDCSPFGMPAHSDWVMHAPYQFDRSMIHNDLIYRTSNDMGRYAVRTKLIEHIHNEQSMPDTFEGAITGVDYFGVYSFMEKITRGSSRVDVENLTIADNALPNIAGGYMFKADRLDSGEVGITPLAGQSFGNAGTGGPGANVLAWVNPREVSPDPFKRVTPTQRDWFRGHLGDAWATLSGPMSTDPVNGYAKYWDVGAMIDHHIINTATKNADALRLSSYWHKPRMGKLTAGPIWDFDRAQGSTDGRDFDWGTWTGGGTDFFTYPWYKEMLADQNFWQAWIDRYTQLRQGPLSTAAMNARIDDLVGQLNPGNGTDTPAKRTVQRWTASAPRASGSNTAITNMLFNGQYVGEIAWLKYWWDKRLTFMESQFVRPAVASVPAGKVTAGTMVTLSSPSQSLPGVKIYYTTNGVDPRGRTPGPLLATGAVEYTGPITINANTVITVRTYNPAAPAAPVAPAATGWSAPTVLAYTL